MECLFLAKIKKKSNKIHTLTFLCIKIFQKKNQTEFYIVVFLHEFKIQMIFQKL